MLTSVSLRLPTPVCAEYHLVPTATLESWWLPSQFTERKRRLPEFSCFPKVMHLACDRALRLSSHAVYLLVIIVIIVTSRN